MTAPGIYQAKVIAPFANGSCTVVIPQLFGEVQVPITRFMGSVLPLTTGMGWVMFEGADEDRPVWVNTDTAVTSADWYVTKAELDVAVAVLNGGITTLDTRLGVTETQLVGAGVVDTRLDALELLLSSGSGAPPGTGSNGQRYYDTTNERYYISDGVGWIIMYEPWQTDASPGFTNVTIGDGVWNTALYQRSNGNCRVRYIFILGSTSAMGGSPTINMPIAAATNALEWGALASEYWDVVPGQVYHGTAAGTSTTDALMYYWNAGGVGPSNLLGSITSTAPFTWAVNDQIIVTGSFPMATLYL